MEQGNGLTIGEELCRSFKSSIASADDGDVLVSKQWPVTGGAVGEALVF